jgi:hypothetical protein
VDRDTTIDTSTSGGSTGDTLSETGGSRGITTEGQPDNAASGGSRRSEIDEGELIGKVGKIWKIADKFFMGSSGIQSGSTTNTQHQVSKYLNALQVNANQPLMSGLTKSVQALKEQITSMSATVKQFSKVRTS